jgi:DNA-binding NarL/FixJ family response regulator
MLILIADDQPKVRLGLRVLLERQAGFVIVGEVEDTKSLLAQTRALLPDLVLLSWELPGLRADDTLSSLYKIYPDLAVIALSGRPEARQAALQAGADAFVSKADPPERLLVTIQQCRLDNRIPARPD